MYVCVCVAMRLMSAIVAVSAVLHAQADTTQRRYQLEKNKNAAHRATERLEELQSSYNEVSHAHTQTVSDCTPIMLNVYTLYKSVKMHYLIV